MKRPLLMTCAWLVVMCAAAGAFAEGEDPYAAAQKTYDGGDYAGALERAERGFASSREHKFLLLKARALDKVGRHDAGWEVMKLIQPGMLPKGLQDLFVSEYERMDKEHKQRAAALKKQREQARIEQEVQRRLAASAQRASAKPAAWRWVLATGVAGLGAGLAVVGSQQATQANSDLASFDTYGSYESSFDQGQTLHGVGLGLSVVGAGLLVWTLIDHVRAGGDSRAAGTLQPSVTAGPSQLGLSLRF